MIKKFLFSLVPDALAFTYIYIKHKNKLEQTKAETIKFLAQRTIETLFTRAV